MIALMLALQDYAHLVERVRKLDEKEGVTVTTLATSPGGRHVHAIAIGPDSRPAILIVGIHRAGSELALALAETLAPNDACTYYVIPRPNPDALEETRRERGGNDRRSDIDRDGDVGEDPPDDLNGDGLITMMRVEDETGEWTEHAENPRILVKAEREKNQKGRWALHVEGRDDDGDEAFNEDAGDGVDFNRNFPHRYPAYEAGAGPNAVSEPESRGVADFAFDHPNIAVVYVLTPEDNLVKLWEAGDDGRPRTKLATKDKPIYEYVAGEYKKAIGVEKAPDPPAGAGSFSEWAYFQFGRWTFASRGAYLPEGDEAKLGDDAFVAWTQVEHPDFPGRRVEVGGFKPYAKFGAGDVEKHRAFVESLAGWLPSVALDDLKVEPLGGGVFRVTATAVNSGYLPTMSEMGRVNGKPYPLQMAIALPEGASLLTGDARVRLEPLGGNGGKAEVSWVVRGAGEATVTVAGAAKKAELK